MDKNTGIRRVSGAGLTLKNCLISGFPSRICISLGCQLKFDIRLLSLFEHGPLRPDKAVTIRGAKKK